MITLDVQQGTDEWFAARVGIPTSSNFDKIVTTKGEPSKQAQKYMYQLAVERITGVREDTYQSAAMQRGTEMEAEARNLYEMIKSCEVTEVGLCFFDENKLYAASPDGLVGSDGLLEIKCPLAATHVSYLLDGGMPSDYIQQVQGQLLVTGRKWVDFLSFFPGVRPHLVRVERDEKFLKALAVELEVFCKRLDEVTSKIK